MQTILYTKNKDLIIRAVYVPSEKHFAIVFEYPDGELQVVEEINSVMGLLPAHDFWCKFTGITSTPISRSQVKEHLTTASLRAC